MFDVRVHAYLRADITSRPGADAVRVGPFLASFDHHDSGLFRNYAVPDDGAEPTSDEVTDLITAFSERGRVPRLEYLPGLCPRVEAALCALGFAPERRLPVMICSPTEVVPAPVRDDSVECLLASSDEHLRQVAEAQNDAYGQAATTDHDVARLRRVVEAGGLVALAVDTTSGRGVGGGLCAPPHEGVSELAAIGVRAPYRRRGIATALTALLTQSCPGVGITVPFLTPAGEDEERIYRAVGYRRVAEMLHISRAV
ncbi:Acetyltransferase (GNAT) domain [Streptoalloteichus tenebrarius]|uniref:Acetyltransferase (GNAT) domain n=1 Tax=Streptoalloteichus tenebrarius (strain ATCC 17920 / DSM 40477 / JCM 4838 / CBS 697.72 / NBRC 16177 / NCIMB 11028 / NRRL B-12390 / A12253. 1 / ISP 5477) TaxID=1933 RepID=A0ABT1HPS4_STRSD|nr:GNAT family N-acetyltransferase [Streptoalloteichus tenebrarius]MCP2257488.1 Acetyltransferase (GNAT) domain [Streptoalloteichus tenebrarius]BFE98437.1 GNAT family N-acetyltransferase [Streptoalloteichus tenebrarius]